MGECAGGRSCPCVAVGECGGELSDMVDANECSSSSYSSSASGCWALVAVARESERAMGAKKDIGLYVLNRQQTLSFLFLFVYRGKYKEQKERARTVGGC